MLKMVCPNRIKIARTVQGCHGFVVASGLRFFPALYSTLAPGFLKLFSYDVLATRDVQTGAIVLHTLELPIGKGKAVKAVLGNHLADGVFSFALKHDRVVLVTICSAAAYQANDLVLTKIELVDALA